MPPALLLATMLAVVVVGTGMQRVTGLGFALVSAPPFVLLLGPVLGVVLVNVCSVIVAGMLTIRSFRHVEWRRWMIICAAALVGIVPGAFVVHLLPHDWLDIVVGSLIVLGLTASLLVRARLDSARTLPLVTAGALSGVMSVTSGAGGPPLGVYGVLSGWTGRAFAATVQPVFVVIGAASLVAKFAIEPPGALLWDPAIWITILGGCVVGVIAGELLAKRVTPGIARILLVVLALAGAITVLVRGALHATGAV